MFNENLIGKLLVSFNEIRSNLNIHFFEEFFFQYIKYYRKFNYIKFIEL